MKPNHADRTVVSTVSGEAVGMAIAEGAEKHLMGLLTNLYEDPETAVIREYSTNGFDSHVEAGITRPIEVSLPTSMRPFLVIRDYGVGLDEEGIRHIYSQYGASTKRDTNEAVGTFGLGCKSALAYADQFTLTAWKDGKRMAVSVSRDEHGAGVMTILEPPRPDAGETGVEVTIPARRGNEMATKAAAFFRFWTPGSVLVNGEEPQRPQAFALTSDLWIISETGRRSGYFVDTTPIIVMGNVPYAHDLADLELPYNKRLVARVPIGSCDVAPAREGLMDTAHTRKTLEALVARFNAERQGAAQRELDKAADRAGAVRAAIEACESLGIDGKGLTWKREEVPLYVKRNVPDGKDQRFWHVGRQRDHYSGRGNNPADRMTTLPIGDALKCEAWITGFSNQSWSRPMRNKLDHYIDAHDLAEVDDQGNKRLAQERTYALVSDASVPMAKWFGPTVVKWSDIKAWKDPARATGGGAGIKTAGTYPVYPAAGAWQRTFPAADIDTTKLIVWRISRPGESSYAIRQLNDAGLTCDFTLVELNPTRLPKFKRDFPQARVYDEVLSEARAKLATRLTTDERDAIATFADDTRDLTYSFPNANYLPDDTDDPEWNRLIKLARVWHKTGMAKYKQIAERKKCGGTALTFRPGQALKRYPLFHRYMGEDATIRVHAKAYINAIHNEGGTE